MWCWRRLLRVPWTAGRSKQSIWSLSVVSDSSRPHGLQPTRPLHPWDLPGKGTGVGCHCLLRILKEINPKYSLEGMILKLKLQNLGHLVWRTDSLEKTLMLAKIEGRRIRPSAPVILEPKKIKSVTVSVVSSSICQEVMEPDALILVFWMLNFKPAFSLSSFITSLFQCWGWIFDPWSGN